jgi:hypothetical protein
MRVLRSCRTYAAETSLHTTNLALPPRAVRRYDGACPRNSLQEVTLA